ncbi:MAG: aldo/keto reductase [Clostridiaceae bacterium]|nr:aldo/keto reductase [Clostridiaceae bacterium]
MMEYITLRNTDIKVSRLCMGGCPMGQYGWGGVNENELIDAVHTALDSGVTMFDTADTYGLGKSEETLAKGLGNHRHEVVIATKFGVRVESGKTFYDNSPAYIEKALCASLRRLKTDYIDLYQVHYRDGTTSISDVIEALERMKQKGYIRAYGLSNIHEDDLPELKEHKGRFVSMQDEYSLACRKNEDDLFDLSRQLELTPMTWGSLGQGILSGKYTEDSVFGADDRRSRDVYVNFHGDKLKKNLQIVERMRPIAEKHGVSVSSVAVRFILDHIPDSVVLVGVKRPAQMLDNVSSMGWTLATEELNELDVVSR